jgi:hypothetical protein
MHILVRIDFSGLTIIIGILPIIPLDMQGVEDLPNIVVAKVLRCQARP